MSQTTSPPQPPPLRGGFADIGDIRRVRHGRIVAGVAGGISRHFDIDPTIVRVLLVVATFFGGAGLWFYAAAWLTVPEDGRPEAVISSHGGRDADRVATVGLIVGAVIAAASMFGTLGWAVPHPGPLAVVIALAVVGLVLLLRRRDDDPRQSPWWPKDPPETGDRGLDATDTSTRPATVPTADEAETTVTAEPTSRPADAAGSGTAAWWEVPPNGPAEPVAPTWADAPVPPPPRRPKSHLFGLTLATIAIAMGLLWAVDGLTTYDLDPSVYPGTALGIIAAALVLGTWFGRSRGLIVVGILASLATLVASFVGPGPYGERVYHPVSAAQVRDSYHLGVGHLVLNLENLSDPHSLSGRQVSATMRIGQLEVIVPSSIDVTIDADVSSGDIRGLGPVQHGSHGEEHVVLAASGTPDLVLKLDLDIGEIRVTHVACPSPGSARGELHGPACR